MAAQQTSRRPYLVRAMHEWMTANNQTPHLVVDASISGAEVLKAYVREGRITLNVGWQATQTGQGMLFQDEGDSPPPVPSPDDTGSRPKLRVVK